MTTPREYTSSAPAPARRISSPCAACELIERCPVCLYAGSLVPAEIVAAAPTGARVLDTAPMTLDEISPRCRPQLPTARRSPASIPATRRSTAPIAEQMRRLDALGIAYDVTPGVPAFAAAAAALGLELTLPEVEPDHHPDAHGDEVLRHAGGRGPRDARASSRARS